ncbi:MAG: helix-turn-helix transcriptional regulator [Phycisphaerales bacterium]|nr:helix-turn-helix transcriptional regulator [Phycisphaerales bacterium]
MSKFRNKPTLDRAAAMLKALGHPHRLSIFLRLVDCCGAGRCCGTEAEYAACVGDLGADLDIAPSTLSHHVKELRQAGLIRVERNGQRVECGVDLQAVAELRTLLHQFDGVSAVAAKD